MNRTIIFPFLVGRQYDDLAKSIINTLKPVEIVKTKTNTINITKSETVVINMPYVNCDPIYIDVDENGNNASLDGKQTWMPIENAINILQKKELEKHVVG